MDDKPKIKPDANDPDRPIDYSILPELIGYNLRRAQVQVFSDFVTTMNSLQITPGQFGVIALIQANPGLTQSALARAVGIERSTMVAVIDALEKRDIVERRRSPVDRRSYALVLTDAGEDLASQLIPIIRDHEARLARSLNVAEKRQLIDLLSRLSS